MATWPELFPELERRTRIVGVLNVTPDSFSDGGRFTDLDRAIERARALKAAGADLIDVGGESTRPGAEMIDSETEMARVVPIIERIAREKIAPISIDTRKAKVADAAIRAGASIVNDVSALTFDPDMQRVVKDHGALVILMHARADPSVMQRGEWSYEGGVTSAVLRELGASISRATAAGISRDAIAIDPGIGFGKTIEENLELLAGLSRFCALGRPVLIGTSRKSFIGKITGKDVSERIFGTAATVAWAISEGAHMVRVHDVEETLDVVRMCDAIKAARKRI